MNLTPTRRKLIKEIQAEMGERYEYTQHINGSGILMCCLIDKQTGFSCRGNKVHFGSDPKQDARKMRDMLVNYETYPNPIPI